MTTEQVKVRLQYVLGGGGGGGGGGGVLFSLIPRPSTPPAFDRFQYANWKRSKAGGVEGLGMRLGSVATVVCFYHSVLLAQLF